MRLFWEKGFSGVSLPELEERTGLSRSSLYNSFGSKQQIFEQSLQRYREEKCEQICHPLEAGDRGLDDLLAFIDSAYAQFTSKSGGSGCLLVNCMVEFGGTDETVSRHASEHLDRLRKALSSTLMRAVALGEISTEERAEKVDLLLALLLGICVATRAGLAPTQVGKLVQAMRVQIRGWTKHPAKSRG